MVGLPNYTWYDWSLAPSGNIHNVCVRHTVFTTVLLSCFLHHSPFVRYVTLLKYSGTRLIRHRLICQFA